MCRQTLAILKEMHPAKELFVIITSHWRCAYSVNITSVCACRSCLPLKEKKNLIWFRDLIICLQLLSFACRCFHNVSWEFWAFKTEWRVFFRVILSSNVLAPVNSKWLISHKGGQKRMSTFVYAALDCLPGVGRKYLLPKYLGRSKAEHTCPNKPALSSEQQWIVDVTQFHLTMKRVKLSINWALILLRLRIICSSLHHSCKIWALIISWV